MDKSVNQSRLSRSQLPPQQAGDAALSLDQLTDLDQAISLSRSDRPTTTVTPLPKSIAPQPPKSVSSPTPSTPEPPVVPVRSAKEAINAMYSGENPARLSDYLGASAREITNVTHSARESINAASAKKIINATAHSAISERDTKSASSLHHASSQRKIETARPSASAIFRAAKSEKTTPVVHTSLQLDPHSPAAHASSRLDAGNDAKSSPIIIASRSRASNSRVSAVHARPVDSIRPRKSQIEIATPSSAAAAVSAIEEAASAITGAKTAITGAKTATTSVKPTITSVKAATAGTKPTKTTKSAKTLGSTNDPASRPASRRGKIVDGFTRPVRPAVDNQSPIDTQSLHLQSTNNSHPPHSSSRRSQSSSQPEQKQKLPIDSIKRRFRLAPKGFAAKNPEQARPARHKFMSFSNPDYTVPIPKPSPAVEIYGLTNSAPNSSHNKDGLGVVEDYRPQDPNSPTNPANPNSPANLNNSANPANPTGPTTGTSAANHIITDSDTHEISEPTPGQKFAAQTIKSAQPDVKTPSKSTDNAHHAPDNNRYALGGQSPFFLKSVSVEKRPLSDAPTRRSDTISPIYSSHGDEVPRKNVYDGKSASKDAKKSKKSDPRDLPQRPTVIIPSSRRSYAPILLLLALTVILGAAVGAAAYFFFFQ